MEENQEHKHICKYCKKGFPCGRSLGGHMRSHMNTSTETEENKLKKKMMVSNGDGGIESKTVDNSTLMVGYVLRENPKKTWRISDSSDGNLKEEKLICKECGKGFQSSKALFGHMRCHSEKEKVFESLEKEEEDEEEEEDSWGENQKLVMDSDQSDNEAAEASSPKGKRKMRRRSRRRTTRYKTSTNAATFSLSNFPNAAAVAAASSSVSEIEHEQEEVAMCLMMLSRDVTGLNCLAESSGNNSVLLEAKSLRNIAAKRFRTDKESRSLFCNGDENVKEKKSRGKKKLGSRVSEPETVRFEKKRSELGGFESGFLRIESAAEVSVDGFFRDVEFKKSKLVHEAEFEVFDVEFERNSYNKKRVKCSTAELGKNLSKERSDLKLGKYNSSNKRSRRTDSYEPAELEGGDSCKKARYDASDSEICKESPKKSKYKCMTCNKIFHSYQALGGHRASHKKIKGCFASKVERSSENSIETDMSPDPTAADSELMKSSINNDKELIEFEVTAAGSAETSPGLKKHKHECPICFKVFSSGQALGGHKRSHLVGGSDQTRSNQSIVIQKQVPEIRDLLDLNLPAPDDEQDSINGELGFKPWWVGNNHKHEPLVGLI